jgi:hypothetical protein
MPYLRGKACAVFINYHFSINADSIVVSNIKGGAYVNKR